MGSQGTPPSAIPLSTSTLSMRLKRCSMSFKGDASDSRGHTWWLELVDPSDDTHGSRRCGRSIHSDDASADAVVVARPLPE